MLRSLLFVAIALVLIMLVSTAHGLFFWRLRLSKLRKLAATRRDVDSWAEFRKAFPAWPDHRLKEIYAELLILVGIDTFPLLPDDLLIENLDIDRGDLYTFAEKYFSMDGLNFTEDHAKLLGIKNTTVRQLLDWIETSIPAADKPITDAEIIES